jgi:hypothetical protein
MGAGAGGTTGANGGPPEEPGLSEHPQVRSWFAEGEGGWSSEADQ